MLQRLKYHMPLYINLVISAWEGNRKNNAITLYKEQKTPNGMDGFYKINFTDISEKGNSF